MPRGIYIRTEETRKNLALAKTGTHRSSDSKKRISEGLRKIGNLISERNKRNGIIPPSRKGIPNTEEAKRKISDTHKKRGVGKWMKGRHLSKDTRDKISETLKGKIFSKETREKISKSKMGERHHLWKGGVSSVRNKIEGSFRYKEWRQKVFIRDNFTCQKCGKRGGMLNAHHKKKTFSQLLDEIRQNLPLLDLYDAAMIYTPLWDIGNGETLCDDDHKDKHWKKK